MGGRVGCEWRQRGGRQQRGVAGCCGGGACSLASKLCCTCAATEMAEIATIQGQRTSSMGSAAGGLRWRRRRRPTSGCFLQTARMASSMLPFLIDMVPLADDRRGG